MARDLVTRRTLGWQLAANAATKPLNVAIPAAVAVAGFVFAWWLLPVAFAIYLALVLTTFFDQNEAERVGKRVYGADGGEQQALTEAPPLAPEVSRRLADARAEVAQIRAAVADARLPFADVNQEVDQLMRDLERLATRAQTVRTYLDSQDPTALRARAERLRHTTSDDAQVRDANEQTAAALDDQLRAQDELRNQLERFGAQMEHIVATLGTIHAQIVRMSVTEEAAAQGEVANQVRQLRAEVGAAADGMREAYERTE